MALLGAQLEHGRINIHFRHVYGIMSRVQGTVRDRMALVKIYLKSTTTKLVPKILLFRQDSQYCGETG